ncbi:hypothetical protein DSM101010T_24350 [Desulfovibrio subterraneus]|uniref:Uncharacterized protein n=1 Tax=Desulfovibrio subterraneus TaxID=2718620 RepID=A0A7J0BK62_9BACT|nr:hypothetical protein DSM101010T_24350 [Desulfovibrio subterraneus]
MFSWSSGGTGINDLIKGFGERVYLVWLFNESAYAFLAHFFESVFSGEAGREDDPDISDLWSV